MALNISDREVQVLSEMRRCRHFTGIQNDVCEAGVNYRELVGGDFFGWAVAIPCLGDVQLKHANRPIVPCPQRSHKSMEEAEEHVDSRNAHTEEVLRRIEAGEDVPGVIVCGLKTKTDPCPTSVDGKCRFCGGGLMPIYGIGSGYGGIGGYNVCTNDKCDDVDGVYDFVEDDGE